MKKSRLTRKTPLKGRAGPVKPREDVGLPKGSVTIRRRLRALERFKTQFHSEEFVRFVKSLPCRRCGRRPSEMHHEPPRSRGGTWEDVSPLCRDCHTAGPGARHTVGQKTFWRGVGTSPTQANQETHKAWLDHTGETT